MKRIPFLPFPLEKALKISKPLLSLSSKIVKLFPSLNANLSQADIKLKGVEYLSIAIFCATFWFILIFSLFFSFTAIKIFPANMLKIGVLGSVVISVLSFVYVISYPKLITTKRVKSIEKNLLFALRHLLIQVRSGVTLFDAMISVSKEDYGTVSEEFGKCVKAITTGTPEIEAIDEIALKNQNLHFRRILWQLSNAMKAGADIGNALQALIENLSSEQRVEIKKYGSQLNPLALVYMMFTVVMPSLGIAFLFVISSFSGLMVSESIFYMILVVLVVFQFMFISLIKSRRPAIGI